IVRLNRVVQNLHVEHEPGYFRSFDEAEICAFVLNAIQDSGVTFLLAVDNGKVLGYAMIRVNERAGNAYVRPRKFLELEQLAVAPESRGQGVGAALVDESLAMAKSLNGLSVELSVWQFNENARRLFHRKGFEPCLERMRIRV
ncbi:MAG: GNAT family N-acetyltransferase, partial [Candidatus Hydrogenedentes bacterium]|nr:GNAT family N-acetyltransferase [Candidatus Hydrogenedentota bacterium]